MKNVVYALVLLVVAWLLFKIAILLVIPTIIFTAKLFVILLVIGGFIWLVRNVR